MSFDIVLLKPGDQSVLDNIAQGVFDDPIVLEMAEAFLNDPRHHLAVAVDDGKVIGFASAVHYLHPDKPVPEMWINEIGVAPDYRGRGIAKALLDSLFGVARQLGCQEAWVLTERDNAAAMRLYRSKQGLESPNDVVLFSFELADPSHDGDRGTNHGET